MLPLHDDSNEFHRTCVTTFGSVRQSEFGVSHGSSIHRSADLMPTTAVTTKKLRHHSSSFDAATAAAIDPWDSIAPIREINADRSIDSPFGADFSAGVPSV